MIGATLTFVVDELNRLVSQRFPSDTDRVVLSDLVNQDGTVLERTLNKVVVTLVNIEWERQSPTTTVTVSIRALTLMLAPDLR